MLPDDGRVVSNFIMQALKNEDIAPDFTLLNQHGESVTLSEVAANNDFTVITFYRGSWCPYCNLHLLNYQKHYETVRALGADIIALTAEQPEGEALATELGLPEVEGLEIARPKIEFSIVHDKNNDASRKFGLSFATPESHLKVLDAIGVDLEAYNGNSSTEVADPATYIVDDQLNIIWSFVPSDYRVRADISEVISAINDYKSKSE